MGLGEPGTGHTGECTCHGTVGILKHCDLDAVLPGGGGELETEEAGPNDDGPTDHIKFSIERFGVIKRSQAVDRVQSAALNP
jgi:hypothetical protein